MLEHLITESGTNWKSAFFAVAAEELSIMSQICFKKSVVKQKKKNEKTSTDLQYWRSQPPHFFVVRHTLPCYVGIHHYTVLPRCCEIWRHSCLYLSCNISYCFLTAFLPVRKKKIFQFTPFLFDFCSQKGTDCSLSPRTWRQWVQMN